ncbi:MAG: ADP-ribosylglycohydrolase family protein [Solirubrobacteraceae bacterium]
MRLHAGGAVGDALGAPVGFLSRAEIDDRLGRDGIVEFAEACGPGGGDHRRHADGDVHGRGDDPGRSARDGEGDLGHRARLRPTRLPLLVANAG